MARPTDSVGIRHRRHSPECSICHAQLGSFRLARGDPDATLAHFRRTVALRPDRVQVRIPIAEALVQIGRLDEAAGELRRVLDHYPAMERRGATPGHKLPIVVS